ncbi:phage tail tube protein [Micromonospora sp. WMMD1076]|uniref:phage tail tube protein n=1 Tax=Micromonospora sp. WMMD1076 TaxID=3016103 RepID=UPI00249C89CD|nr:phage tail tube protein [Micromonospora sp. WMMD1076]WFF07255.1 phage tail tube protein [Micromonospora sp. WMMD1076]
MPIMVLKASYVAINGVDRSANTSKAELAVEVEEKDVTTFASQGWKEVLGGLSSGGLAVTFKNDVAASALDSAMWALFGQVTTFEVRATNAVVGTSNPKYTGNILIKNWTPISGSPGDVNEASYTFPTSGVVARATA